MKNQNQTQNHDVDVAGIMHAVDTGADPRAAMASVQARIAELQRAGLTVPNNLRDLKRSLELACIAESQGR